MADFGQVGSASVALDVDLNRFRTQMRQGRQVFDRETDAIQRGAARTSRGLASFSTQAQSTSGVFSRQMRPALQQVGFQVGDMATQLQLGTNAMQVFAIQGGQLLAFFGAFGALAGAALTILGGLAGAFLRSEDATSKFDGSLDDLLATSSEVEGRLRTLTDLADEYAAAISATGDAQTAATARIVASTQQEFAARQALNGVRLAEIALANQAQRQRLENLRTERETQRETLEALSDQVEERQREVDALRENFRDLRSGEGAERRAQEAAQGLVDTSELSDAKEQFSTLNLEIEKTEANLRLSEQAARDLRESLGKGIEDFVTPDEGGGGRTRGGRSAAATDNRAVAFDRLRDAILRTVRAEQQERQEIQLRLDTLGEEEEVRAELLDALTAQQLEQDVLNDINEAGNDLTQQQRDRLIELAAALRRVTEARQADRRELEQQENAAREAARAEEELARALERTGDELIRAAFEGGNFAEILAKIAIRLLNLQSVQNDFISALGGTPRGGGSFLGDILGIGLSAVGSAFGAGFGGASIGSGSAVPGAFSFTGAGFAHGGIPPVGEFSIVGERGPELAFFDSPARVFSNDDLNELVRGGDRRESSVNFNAPIIGKIETPDVSGFRRSQPQIAAEFRRMLSRGQRQE